MLRAFRLLLMVALARVLIFGRPSELRVHWSALQLPRLLFMALLFRRRAGSRLAGHPSDRNHGHRRPEGHTLLLKGSIRPLR